MARRHEGRIAVETNNTRWCPDGFEFRCEDGTKLSVTFVPARNASRLDPIEALARD